MNKVKSVLEDQLWLWLEACERGKPGQKPMGSADSDKVVPFLQNEVREGT